GWRSPARSRSATAVACSSTGALPVAHGSTSASPCLMRISSEVTMRVLLIEDEVELAEVIRDGLIAERIALDVMHTGPDGLWAAGEHPYDVIVLDIMLPGLSGYEICRQIRARGQWTPILILTAKDGEYDQADALDLGADDYLTKPFSFVVLVARLRALVR